ncbi:hypothetical protein CCACVL1_10827, partial [Corchorus capsularis]
MAQEAAHHDATVKLFQGGFRVLDRIINRTDD